MKIAALLSSFILAVSVLSLQASAADVKYYGIDAVIDESLTVITTVTLVLDSPIGHLDYNLDFGVYNLSVYVSSGESRCDLKKTVSGSIITCDFHGMQEKDTMIRLYFYSRELIRRSGDDYEFRTSLPVSMPIERMFSTVKLPPKSLLAEDVANLSYFPASGDVLTDGKRMILTWEKTDIGVDETLSFSVAFEMVGQGGVMWDLSVIAMTSIVVIVMVGIGVYMRRGSAPAEKEVKVLPLLNKDEKRVVDIVARNEGEARQREIVKESDFSKAKVSRLVKNLKERGVVDTEAISGRENKVILKIKGVG